MGFYNVINPLSMQAGAPEDVSQVLANFNAIAGVLNGALDNSNISGTAAIARSKLDFGAGLTNADIATAAAIAYSKLALANGIVNADVNASAAIARSKLNFGSGLVDSDIAAAANIALSKIQKTVAACGYWYLSTVTADSSNRYFSAAANTYFDNAVALGLGAAMVGADGIMYCRQTGTYHISMAVFDNHGAVSGNYSGARLVLNAATRYVLLGAHTAASADTDGFAGGHGSASLILNLNNGDYMRFECWSQPGYPLYMTQTWHKINV